MTKMWPVWLYFIRKTLDVYRNWLQSSFFQILVERGFSGCLIFLQPFQKNICSKSFSSYSLSMESLACSVFFSEFKASLSPSKNVVFIFFNESPLKMIKNAILFHVKSSFCSSDIYIFVLTLWLCRKTAW